MKYKQSRIVQSKQNDKTLKENYDEVIENLFD